jgi:phage tail sheath protein FI
MPDIYHHGATVTESSDSSLSLQTVSTAVIGIIATSEDADETKFPLDTPVVISRPQDGIALAGTTGTLAKALQQIADQVTAPVIVVRVAEGIDDAATDSNVIGTTDVNGRYTGLKALLTAEQRVGLRPRIIGTPGLDSAAVTAAMVTVLQQLRAFGYATCAGAATVADAKTYRATFGARELMLIWPDFTGWDTATSAEVTLQTVAIALGLRAKLDQVEGWHRVLSNVPVNGATGISADVFFDYLATGTDADQLNEAGITTLINRNGFRFWGSRTCDEGNFIFESYTRTAQVLIDTIGEGVFEYSDKPMHASLVRDMLESINAKLRDYTANGYILGGKCWFDPALNDTANLKVGKLAISYDYTAVPPLENTSLRQTFTDIYFADLAAAVTATNNA